MGVSPMRCSCMTETVMPRKVTARGAAMTQANHPASPSTEGRPASAGAPASSSSAVAIQRQFVNFSFYQLDPAFRRLDDHDKIQARSEFLKQFQRPRDGLMCLTYSTVGLRADADFLLWRIAAD